MEDTASAAADRDRRQEATFVNWLNAQIRRSANPSAEDKICNLAEDLQSGVRLIKLMTILCPEVPVPKYNQNPKMRFALMENLNRALEMVAEGGIKTVGIGADNIADGNLMSILGLVWSIIYHVRIGKINVQVEGGSKAKSGKEGLLYWCQRQTTNYEAEGVEVKNFTTSWKDGLALAAIINNNRPDLLDFQKMKALTDPKAVVTEVIRVAEDRLEIPHLLEVEDLLIADDDKVVMAFVYEFHSVFSQMTSHGDAMRRVQRYVQREMAIVELIQQYEKGVAEFKSWAQGVLDKHTKLEIPEPSLEDAWARLQRADTFRAGEGKEQMKQCQHLIHCYENIQLTSKANTRKPYQPQEGILTGPELKAMGAELQQKAWDYIRFMREYYATEKQKAEAAYVELVEELDRLLTTMDQKASDIPADGNESSRQALNQIVEDINKQDLFARTEQAMEVLERNGIPNHTVSGTHQRWDEMVWRMEHLEGVLAQKKRLIDEQIAQAHAAGIPPEKVEEYRSMFHVFSNGRNCLNVEAFGNCLKGEGIPVPDDQVESLYRRYACEVKAEIFGCLIRSPSKGDEEPPCPASPVSEDPYGIPLDNFIQFMWENTQDTCSKEQIINSFKAMAQNKPLITSEDLASMDAAYAEFCSQQFPSVKGGYDYSSYVASSFA